MGGRSVSDNLQFLLSADEMPKSWYNLLADFPEQLPPPLHPGTASARYPRLDVRALPRGSRCSGDESPSERSTFRMKFATFTRFIAPTPLLRAVRLEKALHTPAHIYYKYEGVSPACSHKPNTAIPQAFYNKVAGTKCLASETGAGQWGSSLAFACSSVQPRNAPFSWSR